MDDSVADSSNLPDNTVGTVPRTIRLVSVMGAATSTCFEDGSEGSMGWAMASWST
ncbi:MAG: hypothetical protein ABIP99_05915 [Ilumatobacteraceae bacterium]